MPKFSPFRVYGSSEENEGRVPFGPILTNPSSRLLRAKNHQALRELDDSGSDHSGDQGVTPTRRHLSVQASGNKHGGASQFSTPRSARIENKYFQMHSEPGGNLNNNNNNNNNNQAGAGSIKKSVSRSLRYNNQELPVVRMHGQPGTCLGFKDGGVVAPAAAGQFELEEDLSFWQDHNVQVLVRIRPLSSLEVSLQGSSRCLRQDTSHSLTWCGHPESRFTFDHVACEAITQEKLFRVAGLPMVENCISGYNSCMFAYGQTGSGKTHTMLGDVAELGQEQCEGRGMIPRVFEYLFVKIQMEEEARKLEHLEFACKCSFLEIYNEQISDLLEPSSTNLQLREDAKKGVYVENLSEIEVRSVHDVIKLLVQGSANRKVAATNMNRESSRSHSVFTCVVESKWESDSVINTRFGRLNLVDLAGSERQKSSGAEGDRLKEAANINKSLSTLGLVIMVLVDAANGKPRHVPYRDSKLTFLLQDSLGGNSKTMIISTVSPSSSCSLETLSTLKFAQRAKFIRNNAIVNEDTFGDVVSLRQQIQQLKEEINNLRGQQLRKSREGSANILEKLGQDVLAASLRREAAAESMIKTLGVEIGQLKRLVRQREEDTQRVKMLLRFREEKIRRLEAASAGSLNEQDYLAEESQALRDEVKLLGSRVEHNPEVTRFAMENIRLMDELKRFQDFYDNGERETLSTEISSLRDQLVEILEANAALKDECRENHSELAEQNEKLHSEVSNAKELLQGLEKDNEEITRQNVELREQLAVALKENESYTQKLEVSKSSIEDLLTDQEAHMTTISELKLLLEQHEETSSLERENNLQLETQLQGARKELEDLQSKYKEATEVQEQMESQQLFLINELESSLLKQQEASECEALKTQLQTLQLELQKKDQIRSLEKEFEEAQLNSNENEKQRVEAELMRTRQELEDAQELNRVFFSEKVQRASLEKNMDETRAEAEAETADAIASMQAELSMAREKVQLACDSEKQAIENSTRLAEEMKAMQAENQRLMALCNSLESNRETELQELQGAWEQATGRLVNYLSEGDETLQSATEEVEGILQTPGTRFAPKHAAQAIEVLHQKLQQAFNVVKETERNVRVLNEAALEMSEIQKKQSDEVELAKFGALEAESRAAEVEARLSLSESELRSSEKAMEVASILLAHVSEAGAGVSISETKLRSAEKAMEVASILLAHLSEAGAGVSIAETKLRSSEKAMEVASILLARLSEAGDGVDARLSLSETKLRSSEKTMEMASILLAHLSEAGAGVDARLSLSESELRSSEKTMQVASILLAHLSQAGAEVSLSETNLRSSEKAMEVASVLLAHLSDAGSRVSSSETNLKSSEKAMQVASILLAHFSESLARSRELIDDQMEQKKNDERLIQESERKVDAAFLVEEQLRMEIDDQKQLFSALEESNRSLLETTESRLQNALEELIVQDVLLAARSTVCSSLQEEWALDKRELLEEVKSLKLESETVKSDCISTYSAVASHLSSLEAEVMNVKLEFEDAFQRFSGETFAATEALAGFRHLARVLKEDISATAVGSMSRVREAFNSAQESSEARFSSKVLELEEELEFAREELAAQAMELCEFKEKFDALLKAADAERVSFQVSVADAERKLSVSECGVSELRLELQRAEEKCRVVQEDCRVAMQHMKTEDEVQKSLIRGLEDELHRLQDDVRTKDEACKALERTLHTLVSGTLETASVEASEVRGDIEEKSREMDSAVQLVREEVLRSRSELLAMKNEMQTLRDFRASTLLENSSLKSHILELEDQLECREEAFREQMEELEKELQGSLQRAEAAAAHFADQEQEISELIEEIHSRDSTLDGLKLEVSSLQEALAEATSRHAKAQESQSKLEKQLVLRSDDLAHVEELLNTIRMELSESSDALRLMEVEVNGLKHENSSLMSENNLLAEKVEQLELEKNSVQAELEEKCHLANSLDLELLELSSLVEQKIGESMAAINLELQVVLKERDQLHADLLVATEQLEMAQSLADEREQVAIEARQVAEISKANAEEKDEEINILQRSVGELESIINALENQVGILKREAQMHRMMKEDLESKVQSLKHELSVKTGLLETSTSMDEENVSQLKEEISKLNDDCSEKEAQIQAYTKHIGDLMTASTRQAAQYQLKITELESAVEQSKTKTKGSSSPFKCIGIGLSQQMNSEFDEELAAARKRIGELENIAASRQREVHMLNTKLAEAETMTHDVIRDLLGVKIDISNYTTLLNQEQSAKNQEEIGRLNKQLKAYSQDQERCLQEMDHKRSEVAMVREAAEELRLREQTLTNENVKLKNEIDAFKKLQQELEAEVRKLSGQQNLQQRIHHHARIKEENNSLRMKNEELSSRLRQAEGRLTRASDELSRLRKQS